MASAMTMRSGNPALTADMFREVSGWFPVQSRMTLLGTVYKMVSSTRHIRPGRAE